MSLLPLFCIFVFLFCVDLLQRIVYLQHGGRNCGHQNDVTVL